MPLDVRGRTRDTLKESACVPPDPKGPGNPLNTKNTAYVVNDLIKYEKRYVVTVFCCGIIGNKKVFKDISCRLHS